MFNWLKNLFGVKTQEPLVLTDPIETEDKVKERPAAPTPTKPKKPAAKKAPAKEESKRGRKKTGVTKTDLSNMNKIQLEAYAKKEFGIDIDKRRKKSDLVDEVLKLAEK